MPASGLDQLNTEVMEYTGQPDFAEIRHRAGRRRTRRHARSVAVAALAVLLGTGLLWGVGPVGRGRDVVTPPSVVPSGQVPFSGGPLSWADAGDANHLYAVLWECPLCTARLIGSDDGGRTWTARQSPHADGGISLGIEVRGPLTLEAAGRLSVDGGRTWRDLVAAATPTARVPAGGWLECDDHGTRTGPVAILSAPGSTGCELRVVDPANRTVRPLAAPPPITAYGMAVVPAGTGLWVLGLDGGRRPAVSISRDGGGTWSTSSFGNPVPAEAAGTKQGSSYTAEVSTHDGRTAHVVVAYLDKSYGFRSTDGGHGWKPTNGGAALPGSTVPGITLPDGTHVLQVWGAGNRLVPLSGVDDAVTYVAVPRPGWPALDSGVSRVVGEGTAGMYLATDHRTLAYSTNGTDWHEVTPR
jgi:hypothetical protein